MDVVKKRRKRGEGTVSNLKKKLRAEGKSYENNRGRIVPEKQPPPVEVSCRCRYQCKDITFEQKTSIFNQFYELGDNVKQNSYLMGNLSICNVKRRRHGSYDDPAQGRRQTTVFFTVPDGKGNHLQFCKETFKEIHGITRRRVETLVKAKKNGDVTYIERRGNKIKERKYNSDDIGRIVSHIERFPKEESHYTRSKSSLMYLSQDLNYRRMYDAFIELHPENKVDFNYYKKIIKEKFANMRFQRPRKDTCNTCDLLKSKIMNDSRNKIDHKNKLEFHHRKAERARENMKTDHEELTAVTSDTCTISVDLQQVFFITHVDTQPSVLSTAAVML